MYPVSLGSLCGKEASTQRQVSFLRLTSVPVHAQGDNWLSQVPVLPSRRMPCSRTPVVLPALALSRRLLLPSLAGERVGFPTLPQVVILHGPQPPYISGLCYTACFLATPGLAPTITDDARGFASELLARLCSGGSRC